MYQRKIIWPHDCYKNDRKKCYIWKEVKGRGKQDLGNSLLTLHLVHLEWRVKVIKTNSDSCNGQSLWLTTNGRGWLINLQIIYFLYFCIKMCIETGHLYLNWCLWNIILLGRFNYFKNINFKSFSKLTLNYYIDFKIYTQHYVSLKLSQ